MTRITLDRLGKSFGSQTAVDDLSLDIPDSAFAVFLGPSGCGKTTTLRMIAGLEDVTHGRITIGEHLVADGERGMNVPASQRGLGMVFQSYALWPHMTVRQNVSWPLQVAGWDRAAREARTAEVLAALEIESMASRTPAEISGGQQQRAAIARTIATRPEVILFDEPLSNLDARLRVETRAELGRLHRESGSTSVYVTHDQTEALALATHLAVMKDGHLEQFGTPGELLARPATAFVAGFLGAPPAVLLEASLAGTGVPVGAQTAMFRPQDIRLDPAGDLDFDIVECTPSAGRHLVTGLIPGAFASRRRVTVIADGPERPGRATRLVLPAIPAAWFAADGTRIEVRP